MQVRAELPPSVADANAPERVVDLARYPLFDLAAPAGAALVARGREQLRAEGACVLSGFLRAEAVAAVTAELLPMLGGAYYCEKSHSPYLDAGDPAFPPEHPRNRLQASDLGALADDQIPSDSLLRRLYLWDRLQAFVAALLELPRLYPYADPLGSLNLNVFQPGQQLGWHYDNADWVVTLMLQTAEAGGVYEYVPWSRTPGEEDYDAVGRALDGKHERLRKLAIGEGALVLFRGRHSLHRVTPVEGSRPRLVAVLSYDSEPGVMLTEYNRRLFYGRAN